MFSDTSLDFFLLCSSLRAIVGGPGHVDHCAANAFLDTFAQYHMATSNTFTVSVNWDSWLDVGQAANEGGPANGLPHTREASTQPVESRLLIERRVQESADEGVYEAEMNPAQDWVLDEHRLLMGTAVMPGTGYLEIAREAFERQTQQSAVEMQEVTFIAPLIVQDDDHKIVRTTLHKDDSGYMFSIASEQPSHDNGHPQWQEHASGHICALEGKGTGGHEPLSSVINRLRRVEDDDIASALYGPRWRSRREVYLGANEVLAVLELPTEFRGDLDLLKLHPALMDVAVGLGRLAYPELNQVNYIPFSYKRLRMNEPLHGKLYSHSRFREDAPVDGDVVSYDVTIMDEQGISLVEIEEFTLRQVRGLESAQSHQGVQKQRAGDVESDERSNNTQNGLKSGIFSQEGVDVFARILSRSTLPQVVVSTRDFPALLEAMNKQFTAERIEDAVEQQVSRPTHARPELQTAFAEPRNETERQLCYLWQEVLGIDRIGIGDNFFELGGDSVMAIQIATRASKAGLSLNVTQLFEYQNIGELVESCLQQAEEGAVGEAAGEVDLRAEAVLDPALRPESQMPESQEVRHIFLTGASGFLGAFLLSELLEATDAEVSCLVRASSAEAGQQKLQKNLENFGIWRPELANRIRVIPGDLSLAALGLSPQQFEALAEQIDVIYHVGALVNWVYPYSVLKGPNVLGT
ncbi:MAG: SDR family oxidoreductase, partial [Ktedonobacteraceae bacterium]